MDNFVITIGRQTGSRGRIIGKKLAERLGVSCYDKELLALTAKKSGFSEQILQYHDERPTSSFLYNLVMDVSGMGYHPSSNFSVLPIDQQIFLAQFDTIKHLAETESCVIIGRCADYTLRDHANLVKFFIHGDLDYRAANIASDQDLPFEKAKDICVKTDKKRANYYNFYADKKWGDSSTYDLSVNSQKLGIDGTIDLLEDFSRKSLPIIR